MSNDLPETGTVESLKIMVNTIKQYCLPEYPVNGKGQKPFIGVVLDEVVKEIEASICRQETLQETAAADAKYIAAIPALCRGEEVTCALHVSQPINELRARIAALEKERNKYKAADEALTARLKVDEAYTDALEQMVRELVAWGDYDLEAIGGLDWPTVRNKALALLQSSENPAVAVCGRCGEKLKQTNKGVQYCDCWSPTI